MPIARERRFLAAVSTTLLVLAVVTGGIGLFGRSVGILWMPAASIAVMITLLVTTLALTVGRRHPDPLPADPRGIGEPDAAASVARRR